MREFDRACETFTGACTNAAGWKHNFMGAAYRTRIDAAFRLVKEAYEMACAADDKELGRASDQGSPTGSAF
jgi:hypothetical protein